MSFLLAVLLLPQVGVRNDVLELRQYLGTTYSGLIRALDAKNHILLRNTERLAPEQAAEMRARMQAPPGLPPARSVVTARIDNIGQGLLSFLFDDDFLTEQVNFVFCPAQAEPALQERLMAIQVLLDENRTIGSTVDLLQKVYQMPLALPFSAGYEPVLLYPLRPDVPVTIWNLGTIEALYQPVAGQRLVTAQLWLTDTAVVSRCANIPALPRP
jgi:hypothetical protein